MLHHRRARPTLRVLAEDLTSGWESPHARRGIAADRLADLHPVSELPHPIVGKASSSFGADPSQDNYVGTIASCHTLRLLEIKQSQWRGGIWEDPRTQVCWLVVAGLAKGDHQDHEDFYKRIQREEDSGDPTQWLPTPRDHRLLKEETAARLRTQWELQTQAIVLQGLAAVHAGGSRRIDINHPIPDKGLLAQVDLSVTPVRQPGYVADEILVELLPAPGYAGHPLLWQLTMRVLISIEPPEQHWDRFGDTYSNIGEPGTWARRVEELQSIVDADSLAVSEPGSTSHYTHREHIAGKTITGEAVRALCGSYFVPTQDHESLPECATCQERLAELR